MLKTLYYKRSKLITFFVLCWKVCKKENKRLRNNFKNLSCKDFL